MRASLAETIAALGIDLGLTAFSALSEGACIAPHTALACLQVRLRRDQRLVSRERKSSASRRKVVARRANLHRRITHQLITELGDRHLVVALEDLHVKNLSASARGTAATPGKHGGRLGRDFQPPGRGRCQAHRATSRPTLLVRPRGATHQGPAPTIA